MPLVVRTPWLARPARRPPPRAEHRPRIDDRAAGRREAPAAAGRPQPRAASARPSRRGATSSSRSTWAGACSPSAARRRTFAVRTTRALRRVPARLARALDLGLRPVGSPATSRPIRRSRRCAPPARAADLPALAHLSLPPARGSAVRVIRVASAQPARPTSIVATAAAPKIGRGAADGEERRDEQQAGRVRAAMDERDHAQHPSEHVVCHLLLGRRGEQDVGEALADARADRRRDRERQRRRRQREQAVRGQIARARRAACSRAPW